MRIALAGYAYGRSLHVPLMKKAGAEVVAVATSNPERVEAAQQDHPGVTVVPDLTALIDVVPQVGADVIVLATPTGDHALHVEQVIQAGIPLVCDKPLAVDVESTLEVVEAARIAQVPLTVFQNRRWDEAPLALGHAVREDQLGELRRFEMRYDRWRPEPKQRWRENAPWRKGGGTLLDLGPHIIDAAVQLMGPVTSVYAEVNSYSTPADDDVLLHCRHRSGGTSLLTASSVSPSPGPRIRAVGSKAAYLYDDGPEATGLFGDLANAPGSVGWIVAGSEKRPAEAVSGDGAEFYRLLGLALEQPDYAGKQAAMPVQPDDAVHIAEVIDAARLSHSENRVVIIE